MDIGRARVLVVGVPESLGTVGEVLEGLGWPVETVGSSLAAQRYLRENPATDLVLLAAGVSFEAQLELCRAIKLDRRTSFIAVLVLRPSVGEGRAAEVFEAGGDDCFATVAPRREIEARLRRAVGFKAATDLLEDSQAVIMALAQAIEGKDEYTCGHVDRVGTYAVEIGKRVGLGAEALGALRTGGVVHDIGKVGIPDQILNKPGKLTDEEMAVMRRHPVIGYDILKSLRTFRVVLPIVRWHHERPNGTGYPDGLKGEEIPVIARITSVADVYDAISTDRPYRKAMPPEKCQAVMLDEAARGNLDGDLVRVLLRAVSVGGGAAKPRMTNGPAAREMTNDEIRMTNQ